MIRVRCPRCAAPFEVEDAMRGRTDRCPHCATPVPVPAEPAAETPAVPVVARKHVAVDIPPSEADGAGDQIDRYLDAIAVAVEQSNLLPPAGPGADLYVPVTVKTGGKVDLSAYTDPGQLLPDVAAMAEFFRALLTVPVPVVHRPDPRRPVVQVTLVFTVRGGRERPST